MEDRNFCLKNHLGEVHLDTNYAYYYQVQTQLFVCDVQYCDFVVCTFSDDNDLHIERITKNSTFWSDCVVKAERFFRVCVLPELLGKWYTRSVIQNTTIRTDTGLASSEEDANTNKNVGYCCCHGPEKGAMIGCDNTNCKVEWFHMKCLKISSAPHGKWYCPDCRKLPEFSRYKKRKATA